MAEALFVKAEEALPRDPHVLTLFRSRVDFRGGQVSAIDQVMNGMAGDGEKRGDIADFDQRRYGLFWGRGTICNQGVEFVKILTRF